MVELMDFDYWCILISDHRYCFRDLKTDKFPWFCCQRCGCAEIGFIGRFIDWLLGCSHVCIPRKDGGYRMQDGNKVSNKFYKSRSRR